MIVCAICDNTGKLCRQCGNKTCRTCAWACSQFPCNNVVCQKCDVSCDKCNVTQSFCSNECHGLQCK